MSDVSVYTTDGVGNLVERQDLASRAKWFDLHVMRPLGVVPAGGDKHGRVAWPVKKPSGVTVAPIAKPGDF